MPNFYKLLIVIFLTNSFLCNAQKPADFLPEKPGNWSYSSNLKLSGSDGIAFNKNLSVVAEWFHQNIPILKSPKGFDLKACAWGVWDDQYKRDNCNYGMRSEMNFDFQLFLSNGGKRVVEPPHYRFYINNTESGHGTNFQFPGWDSTQDSPLSEIPLGKITTQLNGLFQVFPFVRDLAPGVRLFEDSKLIVFNPGRPPFWLPVTMRELANLYLEYYRLKNKTEMDKQLLDQLKIEIAGLTQDELNAPAYGGHDSHFVLKANGQKNGLQIMRFNSEYWDRSLPPSAIQFITLYYPNVTPDEMDESLRNNGHLNYSYLLTKSLKPEELKLSFITLPSEK